MKTIRMISLRQIDLSDETFSVNFLADLQSLRSSIQEIGLIQPVILREKGDRYQIVCGFRRIRVLGELQIPEAVSRMVRENEVEEFKLFSLALHENLTTRGFNAVEKALALDKLIHYFRIDPTVAIRTYLPLLSLETNEKILKTFLSLARMEDEVKRYVVKEEVSRSNIRRLAAFNTEERKAILSLISSLKLGENRLKEILTLLEEIAQRDQCLLKEIVDRPELHAIVSHKELTPSQRTDRVKTALMNLRFPRMHQLEEGFEQKKKELDLPPGVSLHHDLHFEGKRLKMEIHFETLEEYQSLLAELFTLPEKKAFQMMLEEEN
ncbi:MAG: ParB/RepB/Spo0J family partition protein [Desulfobacterales bacterium]|nr:ParB/RepB/Spo0J family partition protein [Desulfobacterales bacterium]